MMSDRTIDDAEAVTEVVHWIMVTAMHDSRLPAAKTKFADELAENDNVKQLVRLGCDKGKLINTLAYATVMPTLYPPIATRELRNLARDLKDVLTRMKRIPSVALPWIEERPDGPARVSAKATGGDMHVWPELEGELRKKAFGYEQLARLCQLKKVPSRATFRKFAFLWPVQYIKSSTGRPHYPDASVLLALTGTTKSEKQLKGAFLSASKHYASILEWMDIATDLLHETASFLP